MSQRKLYTQEFKEGAVRQVTAQKRSFSDVGKSLGVTPWTIEAVGVKISDSSCRENWLFSLGYAVS
jgi:hypothetical protein